MAKSPDPPEPPDDESPEQDPQDSGDDTSEPDLPETNSALPPTEPDSSAVTNSERSSSEPGPASVSFGRYEHLEALPRSGMADVYKAWDPVLKIDVALKIMRVPLANTGDEEAERFLRDARALARLDHPNIVRVYDVGVHDDGRAFFTMGFMFGGSLDRHTDRFADPRAAAALVEKVARAMSYVHGQGVLHRDLKPANILLDDKGEPRVSDFGLAKFHDDDMKITQTGAVMGTIPYMAPEQARGQHDRIGPATDIWALGVILYELLTRRRPFEAKTRHAVTSLICTAEPPAPSATRPEVDGSLEAVILKCLEKRPKDRYATSLDLADDLRLWLAGESTAVRPFSRAQRTRRFLRRHRTAAAVVAAALCAFLIFAVLPRGDTRGVEAASDAEAENARAIAAQQELLGHVRSQLDQGQAVELLPPMGLPNWYRPRLAMDMQVRGAEVAGEYLRVINFKNGLVELIPESPRDGYRLRAEVFVHGNGPPATAAGIYVAYRQVPAPGGVVEYWWVDLAFPGSLVSPRAKLELYRDRFERGNEYDSGMEILQRHLGGDPNVGSWRRLAVEVRPSGIKAFWEGQLIGEASRDLLKSRIAIKPDDGVVLPAPKRPTADWLLRGGLGLYNKDAQTLFRNVVVEPLK
jgi:serine/threonine protein kinase